MGYWNRWAQVRMFLKVCQRFSHRYISHGYLVEMQFVASAGSYGTFGAWIIMNSALFKKNWKQRHTHTHSGTELLLLSFGCVKTFSFPHFNHVLNGPVPKSLVKYFYQEVLNLITSRFHQERSSAPNSFALFIHLFFAIMLQQSLDFNGWNGRYDNK